MRDVCPESAHQDVFCWRRRQCRDLHPAEGIIRTADDRGYAWWRCGSIPAPDFVGERGVGGPEPLRTGCLGIVVDKCADDVVPKVGVEIPTGGNAIRVERTGSGSASCVTGAGEVGQRPSGWRSGLSDRVV